MVPTTPEPSALARETQAFPPKAPPASPRQIPPTALGADDIPPRADLLALRTLADLGRTSALDRWCRDQTDAGFRLVAEQVRARMMAFDHDAIGAFVNAHLQGRVER